MVDKTVYQDMEIILNHRGGGEHEEKREFYRIYRMHRMRGGINWILWIRWTRGRDQGSRGGEMISKRRLDGLHGHHPSVAGSKDGHTRTSTDNTNEGKGEKVYSG